MNNKQKLFFSGIAGSGMSALALFSAKQGHTVYGSDRLFDNNIDHPLKNILNSVGIVTFYQNGSGISRDIDLAIFSTAVEENNPDFIKAKTTKCAIQTRPQFLADLVKKYDTIAIAGTSGKSTTSGMLAFLMEGLSMKPNFIGGGRVKQFKSMINQGNFLGNDSNWLVIEACESDGSIVNYYPYTTVILNISLDHQSVEETALMFNKLIANTSGKIIINADDDILKKLDITNAITFSISEPSNYRPEFYICEDLKSKFILDGVEFNLQIPGRYNILNALACITTLCEFGIAKETIAPILSRFKGIERRFDIHLNNNSGLVIDDYAHNPHKISSLMEVTARIKDSICYIFQPHGYGPTKLMKDGYIDVFTNHLRDKDHLILLPIYYAGGTTDKDISSDNIVSALKSRGKNAEVIKSREDIFTRCNLFNNFVIFGARDDSLSELASSIADKLSSL